MNVISSRGRWCYGLLLAFWLAGAASAAVRLEISGASGALRGNIQAHVGELPQEISETGRREQRRIYTAATQAAEALGYYNSDFELEREQDGEDVVFRLQVTPGERVQISAVELEILGEAQQDEVFTTAREQLPLRPGQPLDHGEYEAAKQTLQNLALRRGYFDARFTLHRVLVDPAANTARIQLRFDSGARYQIGAVNFSDTLFDEALLGKMIPFEQGDPYEAEEIVELNRNLLESQYFSIVRVRPLPDQAVEEQVPIDVALEPAEPNRVGLGLGYSTDIGPRAQINWGRRWVNRHGHSAGAQLELSEPRQTIESQYRIPLSSPIDDVLEFQFGLQSEEFQDAQSDHFTLSAQRLQRLDSGWRRTISIRWDYSDFSIGDIHDTTQLVLPGLGFTRTRASGGVDPRKGDRLLFNTEATHLVLGSDIELQRVRLGARWLHTFAQKHRVLLRADAGGLDASDFDKVPPTLRFFAGGDQSVRGFAYNSIGPRNAAGDIVGGRFLLTGSAEYAYQFHASWRLALFADGGNAVNSLGIDPKIGTGFGLHWISPVGPIRLDLAWGVSERDVPFRLHFSMGPQL